MYSTGAEKSKYDIRTFSYIPTTANIKGGRRYDPEDIEDQHRVGICTGISMTMNARKYFKIDFSDDFQYLLQKKYIDGNWNEGSSAFSALKVGATYGFLPQSDWKYTTIEDRKLSYAQYIKKLQAVPESEINRLLKKAAKYKLSGYAKIPVDRNLLADAIDESQAGIITRFTVGKEWYTAPIEPLRKAVNVLSGHLVTTTNYHGDSFRIANSWGSDWADKGTAYFLIGDYSPTEAWIPYYGKLPEVIDVQKQNRDKIIGKIMDYIQEIIVLLGLLKLTK